MIFFFLIFWESFKPVSILTLLGPNCLFIIAVFQLEPFTDIFPFSHAQLVSSVQHLLKQLLPGHKCHRIFRCEPFINNQSFSDSEKNVIFYCIPAVEVERNAGKKTQKIPMSVACELFIGRQTYVLAQINKKAHNGSKNAFEKARCGKTSLRKGWVW